MPRPYNQVVSQFLNHSPNDGDGAADLLEETFFTHRDEHPELVTRLLLNHGLNHLAPQVRCRSIEFLGRVAAPEAISPLIEMMDDEEWWVAQEVIESIRPPQFFEEQVFEDCEWMGMNHAGFTIPEHTIAGYQLEDVLNQLMEATNDTRRGLRLWSAVILSVNYRCESAIPRLLTMLDNDPDLRVRHRVADDLGAFAQEDLEGGTLNSITAALHSAHDHYSPIVRWGAAKGLHAFGEIDGIDTAIDSLAFDDDMLKTDIIFWLQNNGDQAANQPIHNFVNENLDIADDVLTAACEALEALGAIDELIELLRMQDQSRVNIAAAYELRFMRQLNHHQERAAVAERVVECLQTDDNYDISDQAFLDAAQA